MHRYLLPLAFLLSAAPSFANAQAVSQPSFEACGYESSFISTDGAAQNVTFEAGTNLTTSVDIFWVDHGGNIQFYETLFPGFEFDVSTYVGHGWVGVVDNSCAYIQVYHGLQRAIFAFDEY